MVEWDAYREPVKVNERRLVSQFKEFCYVSGGVVIGEDEDVDDPRYRFRCQIHGIGEFALVKKSRMKKLKIREARDVEAKAPLLL